MNRVYVSIKSIYIKSCAKLYREIHNSSQIGCKFVSVPRAECFPSIKLLTNVFLNLGQLSIGFSQCSSQKHQTKSLEWDEFGWKPSEIVPIQQSIYFVVTIYDSSNLFNIQQSQSTIGKSTTANLLMSLYNRPAAFCFTYIKLYTYQIIYEHQSL